MQYYEKQFHLLLLLLLILAFCSCSRRMSPSLPKTPDLSYGKISRVEAGRERASKWFRYKEDVRANRKGRKLSRMLRRTERKDAHFRKRHFELQTPKTQEMMINSKKESDALRNRDKFWPRLKRKIQRKQKEKEIWTESEH